MCGARYKTRPGLTYHYGHSHKEGASDENSRESNAPTPTNTSAAGTASPGAAPGVPVAGEGASAATTPPGSVYQDSYVSFLNQPTAGTASFFLLSMSCACMCRDAISCLCCFLLFHCSFIFVIVFFYFVFNC